MSFSGGYNPNDPNPNAGIEAARRKLAALANKQGVLSEAEQAEYDRLQSYVSGVPSSSSSSNSSYDSIFRGQGGLLDKANAFTEKQMGLSNRYRTLEGATQGQVDEQMNRRILTDGDVKVRLQNNAGKVTEDSKQADARRALVNFRSNGRGGM